MSEGRDLSRRDFLKMGGAGLAGILAGTGIGKYLVKTFGTPDFSKIEPTTALSPEIVGGIEVYGLKEKITSASTVDRFYAHVDNQFAKSNNVRIESTIEEKIRQRKELLNPNERYLEVAVRRSAYDNFARKQTETGVNFPEWIKLHVDVANRCMKNAKPSAEMKVVLRRILVIEDDMAKEIWDEKAYRENKGYALDVYWRERFTNTFPINTDQSWAIADDYRESGGGYFWEIRHESGKTIIGIPLGKNPFDAYFEFPEENDSLSDINNISVDMGLIHEWSHYLLTLPDEYVQDVSDMSQRFRSFTIGTGSFEWPYFSPYLSYVTRANINLKARGRGPRIHECFCDRPKNISLDVRLDGSHDMHIEIRRVRLVDGNLYGERHVPKDADEISSGTSINLSEDLFPEGSNTNCWTVRFTNDSIAREIYLPAAAFNMSKIAGLESVKYNLTFSGYDDPERTKQEVKLVDGTEIDEYLKNSQDPFYAKMKVEGTNTWFVWFLRG